MERGVTGSRLECHVQRGEVPIAVHDQFRRIQALGQRLERVDLGLGKQFPGGDGESADVGADVQHGLDPEAGQPTLVQVLIQAENDALLAPSGRRGDRATSMAR